MQVAVPESRVMGYSCPLGAYCCRAKDTPGLPSLEHLRENVDK